MIHFDMQLVIDWVIQIINVLIMTFVLSKFLYKPVLQYLKNRTNRIQSQITSAESQLKAAADMKALYESKLKNIEAERTEILTMARKRSLEREDQIVAEARAEADNLRARAAQDIVLEQQKVRDEMKNEIIEISTLMASRYVASNIDTSTQSKLFDDVISDLGAVKWQN